MPNLNIELPIPPEKLTEFEFSACLVLEKIRSATLLEYQKIDDQVGNLPKY